MSESLAYLRTDPKWRDFCKKVRYERRLRQEAGQTFNIPESTGVIPQEIVESLKPEKGEK